MHVLNCRCYLAPEKLLQSRAAAMTTVLCDYSQLCDIEGVANGTEGRRVEGLLEVWVPNRKIYYTKESQQQLK